MAARPEEESKRWPGDSRTPGQMLVFRMTSFCPVLVTGSGQKCTGLPRTRLPGWMTLGHTAVVTTTEVPASGHRRDCTRSESAGAIGTRNRHGRGIGRGRQVVERMVSAE